MLRPLIAALLLANLGYFAWTQGWLSPWIGVSPLGDRDPTRLERQVNPDAVRILPPQPASPVARAAATAPACVEAGPFDGAQVEAAEAALTTLVPAGNWSRVTGTTPGTWAVYMGRYLDADTLQRKQTELRRLKVAFEPVQQPAEFAGGLLLGRYDSPASAESALEQFAQRGVRTARVVTLAPPRASYTLRIEGGEPTLVAQVLTLRNDALGRGFAPCRGAAVAAKG